MKRKHVQVLVIGAGPSGLEAAIYSAQEGAQVLLVDSNLRAGGQLFKQIHKFFGSSAHRAGVRGIDIGRELSDEAVKDGIEIWLGSTVIGSYENHEVAVDRAIDEETHKLEIVVADKVVIATGASENSIRFNGWDLPGVMGAGAAQTMINVNRVLPGRRVLMVGSGNVGLIVSYQLMQAGARVPLLVEAAPKISGYGVHAAKISRAGTKILTSHTVLKALGKERVTGAIIGELDSHFQPIPGTEEEIACDTIALAVGMTPVAKLTRMFHCEMKFMKVFSGWVPLHNDEMMSSEDGIYVVGDATGIEEANTALEEGRLAGISIAHSLGLMNDEKFSQEKSEIWGRLDTLRGGAKGEARLKAKREQIASYSNMRRERACL